MEQRRNVLDRRSVPFVMVTRAVLDDERLRASDKSVYATLCMYADNRTSESWPSRDSLMRKAGVSDHSLRKSLKTLEELGYIEIIDRWSGAGTRLSNLYVLLDIPRQI